jgi:hypothetical protein
MTPQCVKQNVLTKHTNAKTGLLFCAFSQWCIGGTAKRLGLLLVVVLGARHSSSISTTQVVSRGCPTIYPPLSFSIYFSISLSLSLSLSLSCSIYLSLPLYLSLSLPSLRHEPHNHRYCWRHSVPPTNTNKHASITASPAVTRKKLAKRISCRNVTVVITRHIELPAAI